MLNNNTVMTPAGSTPWPAWQSIRAARHSRPDVQLRRPAQLVEAVPYRIGPRKATANPLSAVEPLVDVTAVQNYALEFTQDQKGTWMETGRLGGFCLCSSAT